MRIDLFQPTDEGEARILLLIEAFSRGVHRLEGRTKLAKLDFFLRYPTYFRRALHIRGAIPEQEQKIKTPENIEDRMVRYRYGPWDPAYYAILGRLIGKRLAQTVPISKGIGYKATDQGRTIARDIMTEPAWQETTEKIALLLQYLNLQGTTLKNFIYMNFPEVTQATWGQVL